MKTSIGTTWWTLRRFGFTPDKLMRRCCPGDASRVFSVSIPKSGTHLLERALCLHPRFYRKWIRTVHGDNIESMGGLATLLPRIRKAQVVMSHLHWSQAEADALQASDLRTIFMMRDPRDVLASEVSYVMRRPSHDLHAIYASEPDDQARYRLVLEGDEARKIEPFARRLEYFLNWMDTDMHVVRFEELVGAQGGGSDATQRAALRGLYTAIGAPLSDSQVDRVCQQLFSTNSPTFQRGQIRGWQDKLDNDLMDQFRDVAGDAMRRMGYE